MVVRSGSPPVRWLSRIAVKGQSESKPAHGCPRTRGLSLLAGCAVVSTQPFVGVHELAGPVLCE